MRLLATIAVAGSFLTIATIQAQSLAEHGAAAAGATIGTAAGKPLSGAITKIFGDTDDQVRGANRASTKPSTPAVPAADRTAPAPPSPAVGAAAGGDSGLAGGGGAAAGASTPTSEPRKTATRHRRLPARASAIAAPIMPIAPPVVIPPPAPKEPTPQEVASIQVGAAEQDVLATLGVPASRVIVPDDDGHLRESFQYWARGSEIGLIRLDNGVVSTVEFRRF